MKIDVVDSIRQPEYTGENRCLPCTLLNLLITGLLSALVARRSKPAAVVVGALALALIALRGYLVPGTPTLTKRYLPPELLRLFGKEPEPAVATGLGSVEIESQQRDRDRAETEPAATRNEEAETDESDEEPAGEATTRDPAGDEAAPAGDGEMDLETYFLESDVLEPCADSEDLCLTPAFESAWFDEIDAVDGDLEAEAVAETFGFSPDRDGLELVTRGDVYTLRSGPVHLGQWPSRAALVADLAASRVCEGWVPDWETFDTGERGEILNGLRMFLETCPTTGGDIEMGEEVVESCCSSHKVFAVTCADTGERLFEHRLPGE